jgi:branched-chain amino acid aminotransferase
VLELSAAAGLPVEVRDVSLPSSTPPTRSSAPARWASSPASPEIDGRRIGDGEVGELTRKLADLYRSYASTHGTLVV